jgi:phosphosulfolactate phosphohydrolase-like enzyme
MGKFKGTKGNKGKTRISGITEGTPQCDPNTVVTIDSYVVAKVYGKTKEECYANAKLFATSQELLEKLQYMVDAWEDVRISGRKDIMETFTEYAKEAIKKATE